MRSWFFLVASAAFVGCGHSNEGAPKVDAAAEGATHDQLAPPPVDASLPADAGKSGSHDVLTQRGNSNRTGIYTDETVLTQKNVVSGSFGKLYTLPIDGLPYAQPLYVSDVTIGGKEHDILVVVTQMNTVFVFDADAKEKQLLWRHNYGPAIPASVIRTQNVLNWIGNISTPVVDKANGLLYMENKDYFSSVVHHRFHVIDLATGDEKNGSPIELVPQVPGTADNMPNLLFDPLNQAQRPGLLLLDGVVYLAFASHEDFNPWHGFVIGMQYDAAAGTITQKYGWSASIDGQHAGIWQGGQGLTLGPDGNIYAMIANGDSTAVSGGQSYGEAFVKLSPELEVLDWFIPNGYEEMNELDNDIGSGGPVFIPGTSYIAGAGKEGRIYVLDTGHMGHYDGGGDPAVQEFMVTPRTPDQDVHQFYGSPLAWSGSGATRFYIWADGTPLDEYVLDPSTKLFNPKPFAQSKAATTFVRGQDPCGVLALSTNGGADGTSILWATEPLGNPDHDTAPGVLYAFDPVTLDVLWESDAKASDGLGGFAKFVPPTVANGKVYMATHALFDDAGMPQTPYQINVYGLLGGGG